jgi:hypothetical protein
MINPSDRKRKLSVLQQETAAANEAAIWRLSIEASGREFLALLAKHHADRMVTEWVDPGPDAPQPIIRPTAPHHLFQTGYLS